MRRRRHRLGAAALSVITFVGLFVAGSSQSAVADAPSGDYNLSLTNYPSLGCLRPIGANNGAPVRLVPPTACDATTAHWRAIQVVSNLWRIESLDVPGRCLDTDYGRDLNGTQIVIGVCNIDSTSQNWFVRGNYDSLRNEGDAYLLHWSNWKMCMTVASDVQSSAQVKFCPDTFDMHDHFTKQLIHYSRP